MIGETISTAFQFQCVALAIDAFDVRYHYTHCKILVLMVLIIEACEVIRLLHKRLKSENPSGFYPFPCF